MREVFRQTRREAFPDRPPRTEAREGAPPDSLVTPGTSRIQRIGERMVGATLEHFGRIDILLNNAGAGLYSPAWLAPKSRREPCLN